VVVFDGHAMERGNKHDGGERARLKQLKNGPHHSPACRRCAMSYRAHASFDALETSWLMFCARFHRRNASFISLP
jgi:hypothetical protein